jgi:hypothetical protein
MGKQEPATMSEGIDTKISVSCDGQVGSVLHSAWTSAGVPSFPDVPQNGHKRFSCGLFEPFGGLAF